MTETVTEFKNGKMILRTDGIELTVGGRPQYGPRRQRNSKDPGTYGLEVFNPEVLLTDMHYRYYGVFFRGDILPGSSPTQDQKLAAMRDVLREYLTYRGTRTSWTQEDAWLRQWRNNHASDSPLDFQAACSNSNPS